MDGGAANTDLDLFLYRDADGDGNFANATLVGVSASAGSAEDITSRFPPGGSYAVAVVGCTTQPGGSVYDLSTWVVNDAVAGRSVQRARDHGHGRHGGDRRDAGDADAQLVGRGRRRAPTSGVATYHATDAPTAGNIAGYSVVELRPGRGAARRSRRAAPRRRVTAAPRAARRRRRRRAR